MLAGFGTAAVPVEGNKSIGPASSEPEWFPEPELPEPSELHPDAQPEKGQQSGPEPLLELLPEPQPKSERETEQPESHIDIEPELAPDPEPPVFESDPDFSPEQELAPVPEPELGPVSESQLESGLELGQPALEPERELDAEPEPLGFEAKRVQEPAPVPEPGPQSESDRDPGVEPEEPALRPELELKPEQEQEPQPELEQEPALEPAIGHEPPPLTSQKQGVGAIAATEDATLAKARRYQPRLDRAPLPRAQSDLQGRRAAPLEVTTLGADFALLFGAGGWNVELGVLFHRGASMAEEIAVRFGGSEETLWAIDERAFQVLWTAIASAALTDGIVAESLDARVRWVRTAREVHIFSPRADMGGFFSSPRVKAGVENAVICTAALETSVLAALAQVGVQQPIVVSASGIPEGWRCYRGIRPSRTGELGFEGQLAGLNPLADAEIDLAGGVHLGRASWLATHPPRIIVTGIDRGLVLIDGAEADYIEGGWRTPTSAHVGAHRVEVGGKSKTYQLEAAPAAWEPWPAHRFENAELCGALVLTSGKAVEPPPLDVPCWLIGALPGEVGFSDPAETSLKVPAFEAIWALPTAAGRNESALPVQLGPAVAPQRFLARPTASQLRWCSVLRQAAIRRPKFADPATQILWRQYQAVARNGVRWRR